MTIKIFGIKNCDTIKKVLKWLTEHQIEFQFHDYRKDGIELDWLEEVCKQLDWELVLNKRGTTYRQLDEDTKAALDKTLALSLMVEQPAMIKRPILLKDGNYHLGFKPAQYEQLFVG